MFVKHMAMHVSQNRNIEILYSCLDVHWRHTWARKRLTVGNNSKTWLHTWDTWLLLRTSCPVSHELHLFSFSSSLTIHFSIRVSLGISNPDGLFYEEVTSCCHSIYLHQQYIRCQDQGKRNAQMLQGRAQFQIPCILFLCFSMLVNTRVEFGTMVSFHIFL